MDQNPYAAPAAAFEAPAPVPDASGYVDWTPIELFGIAWERFKADWTVVLGSLILMYVINFGLGRVVQGLIADVWGFGFSPAMVGWTRYAFVLISSQFVGAFVGAGFFTVALGCARSTSPTLGSFFEGMAAGIPYFLATMVWGVLSVIGFGLLIIPGFIVMTGLSQMMLLAVDRRVGPMEAARASWAMTRGLRARILGFFLLGGLIILAGALACGVGLLVALPVVMIAGAALYVRLLPRLASPGDIVLPAVAPPTALP